MAGCLTAGEREVWMERIVQSMGTRLTNFRNNVIMIVEHVREAAKKVIF